MITVPIACIGLTLLRQEIHLRSHVKLKWQVWLSSGFVEIYVFGGPFLLQLHVVHELSSCLPNFVSEDLWLQFLFHVVSPILDIRRFGYLWVTYNFVGDETTPTNRPLGCHGDKYSSANLWYQYDWSDISWDREDAWIQSKGVTGRAPILFFLSDREIS